MIDLDTPNTSERLHVLRRKVIGEKFIGMAVVPTESRPRLKRDNGVDVPLLHPSGKPRMELVVKLMALPGCTMHAGLGDESAVPTPGTIVRAILKGKSYGDWIDALKVHRDLGNSFVVGDVIEMATTHAQVYDAHGTPMGAEITTQEQALAVPRERTLGFYGTLVIRRPGPAEQSYETQAEAKYRELTAISLPSLPVPADDDGF